MGADRFSGPNPKQGRGAKRDAGALGEGRPDSTGNPEDRSAPSEAGCSCAVAALRCFADGTRIAMRSAPSHDTKSSRSNGSIWSENALAHFAFRPGRGPARVHLSGTSAGIQDSRAGYLDAVQALFTAVLPHGLAGAPFPPGQVNKDEHDGDR